MPGRPLAVGGPSKKRNFLDFSRSFRVFSKTWFSFQNLRTFSSIAGSLNSLRLRSIVYLILIKKPLREKRLIFRRARQNSSDIFVKKPIALRPSGPKSCRAYSSERRKVGLGNQSGWR